MTELVERLADKVVEDFAEEVDPDERFWPNITALKPLKDELTTVIEDAIDDWILGKKREHGLAK